MKSEVGAKKRRMSGAARHRLLQSIRDAVVKAEADLVESGAREWIERELPAGEAVWAGLMAGMREVGTDFAEKRVFLSETLLSLEAAYRGLDVLRPSLEAHPRPDRLLFLGRVEGDAYGLAETFVETLARVAGVSICDWGGRTTADDFADAVRNGNAGVVGLFPVTRSNVEWTKAALEGLNRQGTDPLIVIGGNRTPCGSASEILDASSSANARETLAQAILLACRLAAEA